MISRARVPKLLAAVAGAVFFALAVTRRLNFDETLALRSGWLDLAGEDSAPAFLMPWTLLAGAVGHVLSDAGSVFVTLRLLAAGGVAYAYALALRAASVSVVGLAAVAGLALANAAFATHALEFRYDAAVLILLLVAYRLLVLGSSPLVLGAVAGILSLHHLKGAYYAAGVAVILLLVSADRRRDLRRFAAGMTAALAVWTVLLLSLGLLGRQMESLRAFYTLAASAERASLMETLGPTLRRDLAWWLLVMTAIVRVVLLRQRGPGECRDIVAIALAALGIGFWIIHPHAWAYLAALPVPFLLIYASRAFDGGWKALRWPILAASGGVVLQLASAAPAPLAHLTQAFAAPMANEVTMLRALRQEAKPKDRVLDPSGVVYFVLPCIPQWYLDSLYLERMTAGDWMRELQPGLPGACTLVLDTYRIRALPPETKRAFGRDFRLLASGLAVRQDRLLSAELENAPGSGSVESFW